jgi:ABC-type branched-subunit amino acid transport system substrate-binding protein
MISQDHIAALFTMFSSAQSAAVQPVADQAHVPYYYTPVWQGDVCDAGAFFNGEVPSQQLAPVIPWVMKQTGKSKWYLLGNDYIWPHKSFELAKKYIKAAGGTVVGEDYVPLGTTDFSAEISKVQSSGADIMIPALVGGDAIAFEKQAYDSGLGNDKVQRLAILYEDNTRAAMGAKVTDGMYFSTGYDQVLQNPTNSAFVAAYRKQFGASAPPITTLSEHAYVAIKAWAQAANAAKSTALSALTTAMSDLKIDTPAGEVRYDGDHYATQSIYVDRIGSDGKASVVKSFTNVSPNQSCTF